MSTFKRPKPGDNVIKLTYRTYGWAVPSLACNSNWFVGLSGSFWCFNHMQGTFQDPLDTFLSSLWNNWSVNAAIPPLNTVVSAWQYGSSFSWPYHTSVPLLSQQSQGTQNVLSPHQQHTCLKSDLFPRSAFHYKIGMGTSSGSRYGLPTTSSEPMVDEWMTGNNEQLLSQMELYCTALRYSRKTFNGHRKSISKTNFGTDSLCEMKAYLSQYQWPYFFEYIIVPQTNCKFLRKNNSLNYYRYWSGFHCRMMGTEF